MLPQILMYKLLYIWTRIFNPLEYTPRGRTSGLYGNSVFNCWRNCWPASHFTIPPARNARGFQFFDTFCFLSHTILWSRTHKKRWRKDRIVSPVGLKKADAWYNTRLQPSVRYWVLSWFQGAVLGGFYSGKKCELICMCVCVCVRAHIFIVLTFKSLPG